MPTIKNILIFISVAAVFILIYIFFIKPKASTPTLVSSTPTPATQKDILSSNTNTNVNTNITANTKIAQDFLNLLLSVKNIKLDDSIFSDPAFINISKHDSSIVLVPDGNEGRINPFAPIGSDPVAVIPITCNSPQVRNPSTNTCVTPITCNLPQVRNTSTNTCVNPPAN